MVYAYRQSGIEVPVNYLPRVGHSSVTGYKGKTVVLAMRMIFLIFRYRVVSWLGFIPKKSPR